VEIVFNFSDIINGILPHTQTVMQAPQCFIQGVNTQVVSATYVGQHHLLGVRLQPHMVRSLLGILPAEVKDTMIDLTLIDPEFGILWHQLIEATSFEDRVQLVEKNLPVLAQTDCSRSQRLSTLFLSDDLHYFRTVDGLADHICYTPRHLSRIVHDLFGLSTEELISYKKFLHSVGLIHSGNDTLTHIAYQSGFYDQAHFCRVFKNYAGITARQYKLLKGEMPFHIIS
jgi:AraC-like DNA-binding protein